MKKNPIVSIIIPNFNGENFLETCLDSLMEQSYERIETIIVDNASVDNSIKLIKDSGLEIELIKLDENTGFSIAVNIGIEQAKGEYIFLLNNDTSCEPDCITNLVNMISKDEKIFSVNSKMIQYNSREKLDDTGDGYCLFGLAYKRGYNQNSKRKTKSRRIFSACAGASLYRKSILNEIGLFDENFFAYLEDVDIGYRANIFGYKNVYCPSAIVYHVISGTTGIEKSEFKTKLSARNNTFLIYKNMPILQLVLNFPFIIMGVLIKSLFFAKNNLGATYCKNSFIATKDFPKLKKT
ncbi:MAG: glycosyltransferase family 2 protein, partial [Clostridiales bacterium]|nr:glycosyltransferase family 2 protein [Clostridiales bacterium]